VNTGAGGANKKTPPVICSYLADDSPLLKAGAEAASPQKERIVPYLRYKLRNGRDGILVMPPGRLISGTLCGHEAEWYLWIPGKPEILSRTLYTY